MKSKRWSVGLLCIVVSASCCAEVLFGIEAMDTLGDIRKKFPNATIKGIRAAWVKEDQAFYELTGSGQPGKLMLTFEDDRPSWRDSNQSAVRALAAASAASKPTEDLEAMATFTQSHVNDPEDAALTIDWVRWVPPTAIPLERYKSKYGAPDKCGFADDDLKPFCQWNKRGLTVTLSDDQKNVTMTDANFTRAELRAGSMRRYGLILESLKDQPDSQPVKTSQKDKARPKP